jgi:hypothetical protein
MQSLSGKRVNVVSPHSMYKWAKNFKNIQNRFFLEKTELRRQKQIEDFISLNGYRKVHHLHEVNIDFNIKNVSWVKTPSEADIILKTDMRPDRSSCQTIIEQIGSWLNECPALYLCINRHYLNLDNQPINLELPDDYQLAITSWLTQSLKTEFVVDLSWQYIDLGQHFTWSIPDRHYFITRRI